VKPQIRIISHSFRVSEWLGTESLPAFVPERIAVWPTESATGHVTLFVKGRYRPEDEADGLALELELNGRTVLAAALLAAAVEPGQTSRSTRLGTICDPSRVGRATLLV
jgi:hypothetical protein